MLAARRAFGPAGPGQPTARPATQPTPPRAALRVGGSELGRPEARGPAGGGREARTRKPEKGDVLAVVAVGAAVAVGG